MLNEFAETYAAQGDTAKEDEAARKAISIFAEQRLAALSAVNPVGGAEEVARQPEP